MRPDETGWARPLQGARVTLLGASGFIGRWVGRALASRGARVSAVVRSGSARQVVAAELGPGSDVLVQDLDPDGIATLLERTRPDVVLNLAGYGVDPSERDETAARRINQELVESLGAELSASPGDPAWAGQRFVHVGSALEYGESRGDLREDSTPNPTTIYGQTKLAGTLAVERHAAGGLRAVTARLFTVYGPGEHESRLVPSLIAAGRGTDPIALTSGRQRRDFTYVEDVVEGLLRLAVARHLEHATMNLATGVLTEVQTVVRMLAEILHIDSGRLAFGALPTRNEEMSHEPVNVERLTAALGWKPTTSVRGGLERTVVLTGR